MASDYLCNLVIPGAAKSGTSALHDYLDRHPMIDMSSSKEPHHFCRDDLYARGAAPHNGLFPAGSTARLRGESSTGYLPWPPAMERIARDLERPKIIMLLRDPVERTFSHYRWRFRLGLEKRPFLQALREDGFGYHPDRPQGFGYMAYLQFSRYASQCQAWIDRFGPANCLVISSRNLKDDPADTLAACFDFLGVSQMEITDAVSENETAKLGRRPAKLVTRLASLLPERARRSGLYARLRHRALLAAAPTPPATMTQAERAFVEDALADDIAWFRARFAPATSGAPA